MSILVGHQLVVALLSRNSERVKQRIADEFGQPQRSASASPLYKNLDQLSLDAGRRDPETTTPRPATSRPAAQDRVAAWLASAGLAWTPAHLFGLMAIVALGVGLIAAWFGGRIAGPIAALLAA